MASTVASRNASPQSVFHKAEIDTTAPFESVKEAVTLFGEKVLGGQIYVNKFNKFAAGEKRVSKDRELHIIQKQLSKAKEQLKNAESTKSQAILDFERAKKIVEDLTLQLEKTREPTAKATKLSETAEPHAEEPKPANTEASATIWQAELNNASEQHGLNDADHDLRKLSQEKDTALEAQVYAIRQVENSTSAKETNLKTLDELSKDIYETNDSVVLIQVASVEAEKEKASILLEKEAEASRAAETIQKLSEELESLKKEVDSSRDLEARLAVTKAEVESLRRELAFVQESQSNPALPQSKTETSEDVRSSESKDLELEEAKSNLEKVTEEGLFLKSQINILKAELDKVRRELADLKRKDAETETATASLNAELHKSRASLAAALAAEAKAKGAASSLTLVLQKMASEVDEAKKERELMKEEAQKAKSEAEERKVAAETVELRLQDALKDVQAAKAAEAMALAKIRDLPDKTSGITRSVSDYSADFKVPYDEYESMSRHLDDSNELAETEKANQEVDDPKSSEEEALETGDRTDSARNAVENDLGRWRDHEERKKAVTFASQPDIISDGDEDDATETRDNKTVPTGSLAEVLNLKITYELPKDEHPDHSVEGNAHSRRRKPHIPKLGRIFNKVKGKPSGTHQTGQH